MYPFSRINRAVRALMLLIVGLAAGLIVPVSAQQNVTISGHVTTPNGNPLLAEVALSGTVDSVPIATIYTTTTANGAYSFTVPAGGTYTITPSLDDDPLNGVSTLDLVMIARHVFGMEPFSSPYQYMAADANNDGQVGIADSLELRLLILGIYQTLPNNSSWRFVPTDYVFPADPLNPPYPTSITVSDVQADVGGLDFYGIKVGDVNSTAIAGTLATLSGNVRLDADNDCLVEPDEVPLVGWIVEAQGDSAVYTTTVRPNGAYYLAVPDGVYEVRLLKPNALWEICADTVYNVPVALGTFAPVDFAVRFAANAPYLTVDLSAPFLRRCFPGTYTAHYCNVGTVAATDAYVDVALDSFLLLDSASAAYTALGGNTFRFELGDVPPAQCGDITLNITVSCDAVLGQTHCSSAHIYPDTLPGSLAYSGPSLEVTGACDGDNVIFTITNNGAAMTQPACYVVIEDIMVQMTGNCVQLDAGASEVVTLPANGSTWRLEIEHPEDYPWSGLASAMLEGCGTNGNGTFSLGFLPQFPADDGAPWIDEDCQPNIGSFDPNDKQGFPLGVGEDHYVPKNQEIEYLIRFQNTGTDTAFNVIVRDTLSPLFDLSTLRYAGGSHAFTTSLTGSGVLEFVFADIMLPDSNVNEPASHGYLKFAVRPRAGLPDGTVVENDAAIFFDFNAPIITNTTRHTLGEQYLSVRPTVFVPGLEVVVFPNPTSVAATFHLRSAAPHRGTLHVFDNRGRPVRSRAFAGNQFTFEAGDLPAGLYFFRLDGVDGNVLAGGRLVVQ